jgi:uncharacterized protein YdaU (DUF1376 family)
MAKPTAWMPMYWGDYLRDTSHLSVEEHGAYLLLIAHYWSTGRALDEKYFANILQLSNYKMKKYLPVLAAFFTIENGHWHHERIERELSAAFDRKDAATARAKHAAATRWRDAPGMPQAIVEHSNHSHSHIKTHDSSLSENLTDAAREPAPDSEAPARAPAVLVPERRGPGTESPDARATRLRLADITAAKRAEFLKRFGS